MSHVPSNSDNAEDKETEVKQESSGKHVHEYFIFKSVAICDTDTFGKNKKPKSTG